MKDWIEIDDTNWEQVMDKVTTKREKELNKQLVSLKNIRNKEPQRQGKFLNKKLAIESLDEDAFEDGWYDDGWTIEDEDVDLEKDLEKTSPYTNIKSNGIYSLNTGWVKHPVQQDIPDIDMEEFEKEFKVWEDKYFDLCMRIRSSRI